MAIDAASIIMENPNNVFGEMKLDFGPLMAVSVRNGNVVRSVIDNAKIYSSSDMEIEGIF